MKLATLKPTYLNGQPVNIASGTSITLLELIETLKKKFSKYNQQILFKVARKDDIINSQANNRKLTNLIKQLGN